MSPSTPQSKSKAPETRFPEFSDSWEETKFNTVASSFLSGASISKDDISQDGKNKCIRYGELYTEYREVINVVKSRTNLNGKSLRLSVGDDLLIPSSGETALDIARVSCIKEKGIILGGGISIIRLKNGNDGSFFAYYLTNYKKRDIARLGQGHSVVHLYSSDFKHLDICIPILAEQQKIASFLSSTDEWIEKLKAQMQSLESYKKGMMQNIFSQEIRFKDDNGKDYSKWEEKQLSELGKTYNGLSGKTASDFGTGEPFITYKQIFANGEIDINKFGFVKVEENEGQNRAEFGDVFITTSSETPLEVGFTSVLLDKTIKPYLNSFSFGFRPNQTLNPYFAKFFFRSNKYRKEVVKLAQGSTRYNISKLEFMKLKLFVPQILEQQKIANFLISIDNLLDAKQQEIIQAEQWKKGLMQNMFV